MFEKYEIVYYDRYKDECPIKIIDSDFEEVIFAKSTSSGLDIMTQLIGLYEIKGLNVSANVAKAYVYMCKRFRLEPKGFLGRLIAENKSFAKYKSDIEKYLALL